MREKKQTGDKKQVKDKSLLGSFFAREERDEEYIPELQSQWESMDSGKRVNFILGAVIGLVLFVGALILVYYLLMLIRG